MTARTAPSAAEFYPSLAATAFGRVLGAAMECLPLSFGRVKLSYLLFGPIVVPLAVAAYAMQKIFGERYAVTDRSVERWPVIGGKRREAVPLAQVGGADVRVRTGQSFYDAGDVVLRYADGRELATLAGLQRPRRVCETIVEAADAARRTSAVAERVANRA